MVHGHFPPFVSLHCSLPIKPLSDLPSFSIASLRRNVGLIALFFCLAITFMLLAIGKSVPDRLYSCRTDMLFVLPQLNSRVKLTSPKLVVPSASLPLLSLTTLASPSSWFVMRAGSHFLSVRSPSAWIKVVVLKNWIPNDICLLCSNHTCLVS